MLGEFDKMSAKLYWRGERGARELYAELYFIAQNQSHKEAADFLELVMSGFRPLEVENA
jgi:hypothetical protein